MSRLKPFVIVGLVGLAVIRGASQDARAVLGDTERALGATGLSSLTYAGTGFAYAFGQNPRPDVPYPSSTPGTRARSTFRRASLVRRRRGRSSRIRRKAVAGSRSTRMRSPLPSREMHRRGVVERSHSLRTAS